MLFVRIKYATQITNITTIKVNYFVMDTNYSDKNH